MSEYFLGMVPDYGLYVVFAGVFLGGLAIPVPSSILVLAAGGFAATGDLVLQQVLLVTFVAFFLGHQFAFGIARRLGEPLLKRIRQKKRMEKVVDKGESMVADYGVLAVLISHTVLSPTAPYVSYICGANAMNWRAFSLATSCSAFAWTLSLALIGYFFSSRISQVSDMFINLGLVIAAIIVAWLTTKWLRMKWQDL